ncbi:hypothetical protein O6P43_016568 [Quillaja saponaria]|uniref:Uncharacterized protein n=1 Tax=Quillaja saponaria TaxID=32244 RepID=A0AAD7LQM1_QUISA|nr:hypothetical protein O6P43_016568 [Quillaja saponaria]
MASDEFKLVSPPIDHEGRLPRSEQNEEADRLKEEIEWYRAFESEAVRLREEKDEEIARLRAELEVSKKETRATVENFKNSDDCQKMIYDHSNLLYANGWVSCRVWLKERNPSFDISQATWPGEEEAEEEERLAKMLAEAEADKKEGSKEEEVEAYRTGFRRSVVLGHLFEFL